MREGEFCKIVIVRFSKISQGMTKKGKTSVRNHDLDKKFIYIIFFFHKTGARARRGDIFFKVQQKKIREGKLHKLVKVRFEKKN